MHQPGLGLHSKCPITIYLYNLEAMLFGIIVLSRPSGTVTDGQLAKAGDHTTLEVAARTQTRTG